LNRPALYAVGKFCSSLGTAPEALRWRPEKRETGWGETEEVSPAPRLSLGEGEAGVDVDSLL